MIFIVKSKKRIWQFLFKNARLSYAQSGEDMILDTIFCNVNKGFYVDVGANNPYIQSNTHYFYKKGWRGVNIDALPGSMNKFNRVRSKDINIEAAISADNSDITYYMFDSSFFNATNKNKVKEIMRHTKFIGEKTVKTNKLSEILNSIKVNSIDFLSVDAEGHDYEILKSNNWEKCRPKVIVTECFSYGVEYIHSDKIYQLLTNYGYRYFCSSPSNAFYLENEIFKERFGS